MVETNKPKKPKKNIVVSLIKTLSEKSANEFSQDIQSGELYSEMKPKKERNNK